MIKKRKFTANTKLHWICGELLYVQFGFRGTYAAFKNIRMSVRPLPDYEKHLKLVTAYHLQAALYEKT